MCSYYEGGCDPSNQWRVHGLRRAIGILRNCSQRIDTYEKAIVHQGIGDPTAQKIAEIASTGALRRISMMQTPEDRCVAGFLKVKNTAIIPVRAKDEA